MNRHDIIENLSEATNMSRVNTDKFISAFIDVVTKALADGDKVQIVGFGTFETTERKARIGHNPKTGGTVDIPAKIAAKFKAGKALKDAVNK